MVSRNFHFPHFAGKELTKCNDVAEGTKRAHVERCTLDVCAAFKKGDKNWNGVADSEEDDTNTAEGVECGRRAEVDAAECNLHHHTEHHGIEWQTQLGVDLHPPLRARDCAIAREGPCATGGGCCAAHTAKQAEDDEGDSKSESTAFISNGSHEDGRHRLACEGQLLNVWQNVNQRNKESKTGNQVQNDGSNKCFWDLSRRFSDFFAHPVKRVSYCRFWETVM